MWSAHILYAPSLHVSKYHETDWIFYSGGRTVCHTLGTREAVHIALRKKVHDIGGRATQQISSVTFSKNGGHKEVALSPDTAHSFPALVR